jgi:hypothetical protein
MAQQTAVDIMFEKAISVLPLGAIDAKQDIKETYLQAKQMEKQQHEETALSMAEILLDKLEGKNGLPSKELFEQYYTQTYTTRLQNETN